jgi:hypothetical protein
MGREIFDLKFIHTGVKERYHARGKSYTRRHTPSKSRNTIWYVTARAYPYCILTMVLTDTRYTTWNCIALWRLRSVRCGVL